jgi:hypothetical protein
MSNRQLEFILTMRDEATKVWNAVETRIVAGAKRLGESLFSLQGIMTVFAGFQGLKMVMRNADEATQSLDRLASALKSAGVYSDTLLKQMARYSEGLMKTTVYEHEQIDALQSLIVALTGMTGTAVEPLVKASLDLATALQIDAVSAGRMIIQSVSGRNILAKYGIEIDKNASQHQNLTKVVDQLAKKFGGFAENEAKTATGKIKQMHNQIGEVWEDVGFMANDIVSKLAPAIQAIVKIIGGGIMVAVSALQTFFAGAITAFFELAAGVEIILNKLGISSSHKMQYDAAIAIRETKKYAKDTMDALNNLFGKTKDGAAGAGAALGQIVGGKEGKKNEMAVRIEELKKEIAELVPASAEWIEKMKEMTKLETILANLTEKGMMAVTGDVKTSLWSKLFWGGAAQDSINATKTEIASFFAGMKGSNKLGVMVDYGTTTDEYYDRYKDAIDSISQMERTTYKNDKEWELQVVDDWLEKVKNTYGVMQSEIEKATQISTDRKAEIESRAFEKTFNAYADEAKKGIGLMMQMSSQKYDAELDGIETAKDAEIGRIDAALQNDKLSAEARKKLEKEKADVTQKYDDEARAVKKKQWEADKEGRMLMAVIDTAAAVVKALPNVPLAILAGAMGAAQVAIIASQATPKFKTGTGAGGFTVPAGYNNDNFPVLVSSGEKVRVTPRGGGGDGATLVFNFNAPVSDEEFVYQAIVKRLRATGMSIDRTFRDSNTMVLGNR